MIDSKLTWQPKITAVCKSFSRKVKHLKRLRVLPKKLLEAFYFRSIVPDVTYGMLVWGTWSRSLLYGGELIHLRAAKVIHGLTEVNMETGLKRIHWQPLTDIYKLKLTSSMHSAYYGLIPKPICDLFHKTEQRPYNLRGRDGFKVPKYSYSIGRTSLSYRKPIVWTILPESYKLSDSHASFKKKFKKDQALLDKLSFAKESCLITNKDDDFYYFWTIYLFTLLITIDYNRHSNLFNQSMFAYILSLIVHIPSTFIYPS